MAKTLRIAFLDRAILRRIAGSQSFARGEGYFAGGRVRDVSVDGGSMGALVIGTRKYRVQIWLEDGAIQHSCTCPMGESGDFCKHCRGCNGLHDRERRSAQSSLKTERVGRNDAGVRTMLLQQDHTETAIELSEHALKAAARAMNSMDDSDGYMRGILDRLQEIHLLACTAAKPDPVALAQKRLGDAQRLGGLLWCGGGVLQSVRC